MAIKSGIGGIIKTNITGSTVAVVGEIKSFAFDGTADTTETSVMGSTAKTFIAGLKGYTLTFDAFWDEADAQQLLLDEGADIDFELYPTGAGSGETLFTGGGIVTSRAISASFDGMVEMSVSVQCSGAVVESQV